MADNFGSWDKVKLIGSGGFGQVWQVRTDSGQTLAAKYIDVSKMNGTDISKAQSEIRMLKQLDNQNVVKFVTERQSENCLVVFTEFIDGKDLAAHGKLSEATAKGYLRQICAGLHYLHNRNPPVLHRDLKGENIMVTRNGIVKLIDFGLSIDLMVASGYSVSQAIMATVNCCGTLPFMAPELFVDRAQFSVKSDVWALGITVYQMLSGKHPYCELQNTTAIIDRVTGQGAPQLPAGCSSELNNFYACCTAMQPRDRKSVRELLQHPVFA